MIAVCYLILCNVIFYVMTAWERHILVTETFSYRALIKSVWRDSESVYDFVIDLLGCLFVMYVMWPILIPRVLAYQTHHWSKMKYLL